MAYDKAVDSQALDGALGAVANAIRGKTGRTEPMTLEQMPAEISGIQTGAELPELGNPGTAQDLMAGKQLLDGAGQVVEGAFSIDAELAEQGGLIEQIQEALDGVAAPDGSEDLNAELTAQEAAIAELMGILRQKSGLVPVADEAAMAKAAAFDIIMNGEG